MRKLTRQYNYRCTDEQWANLERVAAATNSISRSGPNARKPSVTVMFDGIAEGRLIFVEKEPWSLPAGLAEQAAKLEEQQRAERERLIAEAERLQEQQRLEQARLEQQRRVQAHTQAKQVVRKMPPVKLEQTHMFTDLEPA